MSASEDRYVKPPEGEDPREIDRELTDGEAMARRESQRNVTHAQPVERRQGTSADAPGFDPSDRERADEAAAPGEEGAADSTDTTA